MAGNLENRGKLRELIDKFQFAELTQKSSKELFFLPGTENLQVFRENLYLRKKYNINMNIIDVYKRQAPVRNLIFGLIVHAYSCYQSENISFLCLLKRVINPSVLNHSI